MCIFSVCSAPNIVLVILSHVFPIGFTHLTCNELILENHPILFLWNHKENIPIATIKVTENTEKALPSRIQSMPSDRYGFLLKCYEIRTKESQKTSMMKTMMAAKMSVVTFQLLASATISSSVLTLSSTPISNAGTLYHLPSLSS